VCTTRRTAWLCPVQGKAPRGCQSTKVNPKKKGGIVTGHVEDEKKGTYSVCNKDAKANLLRDQGPKTKKATELAGAGAPLLENAAGKRILG